MNDAAQQLHVSRAKALRIARNVTVSQGTSADLINVVATAAQPATAERDVAGFAAAYMDGLRRQSSTTLLALEHQRTVLAQQIQTLGRQKSTSTLVTTELTAATTEYENVQSQIISLLTAPSPAAIYAPATPAARTGSSAKKVIGLAALIGLIAGAGVVLLQERFDTRLRSAGDVPADVPVLAELPFQAKLNRRRRMHARSEAAFVPVRDEPASAFADRVRELRTALQVSLSERPSAVVLVTSPQPHDGKSSLAANLAASWALAGRSAVLVVTDWRRARSDTWVGSSGNHLGLSTLIAEPPRTNGADAAPVEREGRLGPRRQPLNPSVVAAVLDSTTIPGLSLLSTGPPVAVDPGDLLASPTMRDVIGELRSRFEYVVIDTPSVTEVSDAGVLGSLADAVIVVARANRTERSVLQDTISRLLIAGAPVIGVVLNGGTQLGPRSAATSTYRVPFHPSAVP